MHRCRHVLLVLSVLTVTGAAGCDGTAKSERSAVVPTRTVAIVPPQSVADVAAQVPEGVVLIALDVVPMPGHKLALRLSTPTRDAVIAAEQYTRALKPHVAEVKQLLSSGSSTDPEEAAATARELSELDAILTLPVKPESLLVDEVRLRGNVAAMATFSDHFSRSDGGAP